MTPTLFLLYLALSSLGYLWWGFRTLPREQWQFMATMPARRRGGGLWTGINLTWYGFFSANACLLAIALFLVLTGSLAMPATTLGLFIAGLLGLCIPASSLAARLIEKKRHTLTVGGAAFVGLLASPLVLVASNRTAAALGSAGLPPMPVLAALGIAYAFGEGLGRLACLSFGCCYGKPLRAAPRWLQVALGRCTVRFYGGTKKIAYASNLVGERVLPVQALTALLFVAAGLAGCAWFLAGRHAAAFLLTIGVTQFWRLASEFLRADFRGSGGGRLTAYQWMGLVAVPYAAVLVSLIPASPPVIPALADGLAVLWTPAMLLSLQGLWLLIFLATGRSAVTGATIHFYVRTERI